MRKNSSWIDQLKYRWCNIHPYSDATSITANNGDVFWISLDEGRPAEIIIGKNARICGVIRILWDGDVIELCDLFLVEKHRGKGLGSQIIHWIIEYARKENIHQICAIVTPENYCDFDRLMNWYLRFGFRRKTSDGKSIILNL